MVRDGIEGLLVPPGDAGALAAAVRRVLTDEALSHALAAAGRERAEQFRWPVVVDQIESAYRDAVEAGGTVGEQRV